MEDAPLTLSNPEGPVRLRLSRQRGFDLKQLSRSTNGREVVVVSRPSILGNPWHLELGRERAVATHRHWLKGSLKASDIARADPPDREWLRRRCEQVLAALPFLMVRNVACWCRPEDLCHGDTLIEFACRWCRFRSTKR